MLIWTKMLENLLITYFPVSVC